MGFPKAKRSERRNQSGATAWRRRPENGTSSTASFLLLGKPDGVRSESPRPSAQQQRGNGVATGSSTDQTRSDLERAAREDVALLRSMHELEALPHPGELHQVLAHDVAGAQAGVLR